MNILKTTKVYNQRIYLPKEIREILKVENGDKVIFGINNNNEIILFKNKEEKNTTDRFKVKTSD